MLLKNDKELNQNDFEREEGLKKYFEKNLDKILNYKYIASEFTVGNFRIDTLAFDEETKSFKILEFKNVKNRSLVDQGYTYLKLLLERKADFVLKYCLKENKQINISDIDWSQSRIIFVAPVFTVYQLNATDFKNIPIDLIKVTKYDDDIVLIERIKKTSNVKVEEIIVDEQDEVSREIKVYTEEDHLKGKPEAIREVYETLRDRILELDDIDIDFKKKYVAFKGRRNIVDLEVYKSKVVVHINMKKGTLEDPFNITIDLSNCGHHGNGDYCVDMNSLDNIDEVISLVKQSLKVNKK